MTASHLHTLIELRRGPRDERRRVDLDCGWLIIGEHSATIVELSAEQATRLVATEARLIRDRLSALATEIHTLRARVAELSRAENDVTGAAEMQRVQAESFIAKTQLEQLLNTHFDLVDLQRRTGRDG